jgi:D-alanine transaminase/branched-chain amino acid aminotransferase
MSELICFCRNEYMPLNSAALPVNDLGLQRGYGIFDFLRVTDGVPMFIEDHLDRFFFSAEQMRLPVGYTKQELETIIQKLIVQNGLQHAGIRILLTGGPSPDGYAISAPVLSILEQPMTPPADEILNPGFRLITHQHRRQFPQVKTTDYLMAVWLNPQVKAAGADDVLYHLDGMISECPRSNIFIVNEAGVLITPNQHILPGITRKQLLQVAQAAGISIEQRAITPEELFAAKEVFITSSTKRLIPVYAIDQQQYAPYTDDSVTGKLYQAFMAHEQRYKLRIRPLAISQ